VIFGGWALCKVVSRLVREGSDPHSRRPSSVRVGSAPESGVQTTRTVRLVSGCVISLGSGSVDDVCSAIAGAQRGRVSRGQLLVAGVDRRAIDRLLRSGWLIPEHSGVYALGHEAEIELADEIAALLACGPTAMLSHHSAATLWGLRPGRARPIHLTVPVDAWGARPGGVIVHRSRILRPVDVTTHLDLPVTSPARTLLDIAAGLPAQDVEYILEEGLGPKRLLSEAEVADVASRAGRHPGAATLRRVLATRTGTLTESKAQRRLLELIGEAGLPFPKTEQPLLGYRVDLLWPELKLVVEVDGYGSHGTRGAFEHDRRRDTRLQAAGFTVIRVTAREIEYRPWAVIAQLAQAIHLRAS
jgi:very-short-patch-repair endonuclease